MINNPTPGLAGIGTDLIYISRIADAYSKFRDRFPQRILGPEELVKFHRRYTRDPRRGLRFLATRFAAKEAFSKAIGLGMHSPMKWSAMQTLNAPLGKPMVVLSEPLRSWYEQRFGLAHVSLTDESDLAMAFIVIEQK